MKEYELETIIIEAKKGNKEALEELIKREQKNVYASFYYLSPDMQDVLLKMAKNIHTLREPKHFKSWLNRMVANRFFDELRKKKKKLKTVSMECEQSAVCIADNRLIPDEKTLENELDFVIKNSIHKLPEPFRVAIIMRELAGLSYEEIANATNSNIGTVKSRIARARNKLQEYIKPYMA